MGIETRGNDNFLVLSKSAVPVDDVCSAVIDRKKLDWICNRFPVSVDEVFECIETAADEGTNYAGGLSLINTGTPDDIDLETLSVNDTVYFGLIAYGHSIKPDALDFDQIYNIGLINVIKDIYTDLAQNASYFDNSDLHNCVYEALLTEIGNVDPDVILENLRGEF